MITMTPAYRSSMFILDPRIYAADRDNVIGEDITRHITSATVDADIDRAGPKSKITLASTNADALPAYGWVAPFLDVIAETEATVSAQMGLYRLGQPTLHRLEEPAWSADASGWDIIQLFDRAPLTESKTTPVGANVMDAVRAEVEELGITRHAFPSDTRTANRDITHPAGTMRLTRINDLLAAIGYHATSATMDGRPTSRPYRDPRIDAAVRSYTLDTDSRIVGRRTIQRADGNVYNIVVVTWNDYTTDTTLAGVARNDNPAHPWSTVNLGELAPAQPIVLSEAVDQDALQAKADYELAIASMQEALSIDILPDPQLSVYDVIEILSGDIDGGRWAVESLTWGLTADQPLVRMGARRTITSEWIGGQRTVDALIKALIKASTDALKDILAGVTS